MKNIFVDTNIILYYLTPNNPFHEKASLLVKKCLAKKLNGFVSAHSLTDIFYITRKFFSVADRREFLLLIVSNFQVIAEDQEDFFEVLNDPDFFDLEDGLQMKCAENADLDYIVTENLKDFKNSKIPAVSIEEALKKL